MSCLLVFRLLLTVDLSWNRDQIAEEVVHLQPCHCSARWKMPLPGPLQYFQ